VGTEATLRLDTSCPLRVSGYFNSNVCSDAGAGIKLEYGDRGERFSAMPGQV